ncbi:MAG: hypothetical protein WC959_01900 [Kiritimatiellales bacterium]
MRLSVFVCGIIAAGLIGNASDILYDSKGFESPVFREGTIQGQNGWSRGSTPDYQKAEIIKKNGQQMVRIPSDGTQRILLLSKNRTVSSGTVKLSADIVPHKLSTDVLALVCDVNGTGDDSVFLATFERRGTKVFFSVGGVFSDTAKPPKEELSFKESDWNHVEIMVDLDSFEIWGVVNGEKTSKGKLSSNIKSLKLDKIIVRTERGSSDAEILVDNIILEWIKNRSSTPEKK